MVNEKYFLFAMEFARRNSSSETPRIAHGFLTPELGSGGVTVTWDRVFSMAWVENGSLVTMCGEDNPISLEEFERLYQPTFVVRYPTIQAVRMYGKTGTSGPWTDALLKRRPLLPDEDMVVGNKLKAARENKKKKRVTSGGMIAYKKKRDGYGGWG